MSIKIYHKMIFKDKISVRNCKYTKNIINFNYVLIKFLYIVTNFIKSLHIICKLDKISSTKKQRSIIIYMQSYHDRCPLSREA